MGIAAGVAGGCLAAAALATGAWLWCRRAHRRRALTALDEGKGMEPPPGEQDKYYVCSKDQGKVGKVDVGLWSDHHSRWHLLSNLLN